MSPDKQYLNWRRLNPVGCLFARTMSGNPARFKQAVECLPMGLTPPQMAAALDQRIDLHVADSNIDASTLVLPDFTDLIGLAQMARALGALPLWSVTIAPLPKPPAGPMMAIRIARDLPFGQGWCPSEALILGPFPEFPATRQSPVTAFEIFVGAPLLSDPKDGTPTTKANLAHIVLETLPQGAFEKMWAKSVTGRLKSLGDIEDSRAKAKVTFVVPEAVIQSIGWRP